MSPRERGGLGRSPADGRSPAGRPPSSSGGKGRAVRSGHISGRPPGSSPCEVHAFGPAEGRLALGSRHADGGGPVISVPVRTLVYVPRWPRPGEDRAVTAAVGGVLGSDPVWDEIEDAGRRLAEFHGKSLVELGFEGVETALRRVGAERGRLPRGGGGATCRDGGRQGATRGGDAPAAARPPALCADPRRR